VQEFFQDLHVLATHVPNILKYHMLHIALLGLKENIQNELEFLNVNDIEEAYEKEKIAKKKLKAYRRHTSWHSIKEFSYK
jgi:hypothetical protein